MSNETSSTSYHENKTVTATATTPGYGDLEPATKVLVVGGLVTVLLIIAVIAIALVSERTSRRRSVKKATGTSEVYADTTAPLGEEDEQMLKSDKNGAEQVEMEAKPENTTESSPLKRESISRRGVRSHRQQDRNGNKNDCGPGGGTNVSMSKRKTELNQVFQAAVHTEMHQVVTEAKKIYRKVGKLEKKLQEVSKERVEKEKEHQEKSERVERVKQKLSEKEVELNRCKQERDEWKGKYQETQREKEDAQQRLEKVEKEIRTKPKQPLSQNTDPESDLSELEKKRNELEMTKQMLSRQMAKYGKKLSGIQQQIKKMESDETDTNVELEIYKDEAYKCWLEVEKLKKHQEKNNQQIAKCDEELRELQQLVPPEAINITKGEQVELLEIEQHDTIANACDADDGSSSEEEDAPVPEQSSSVKKHASTPENISKSLPSKPECINNEEKPQQVSDNIEKAIDVLQLIENYGSEIKWIESQVQDHQTEIRKLEERKAECQQGIEQASAATGHGSAADEEATIGASVGLQQISADDKKFTEHERNIKQSVSSLRAAQARRSDRERAQHTPESAQSWSSLTKGAASMPVTDKGERASVDLQHISGTEKKRENPQHNFKKELKGIPAARRDAEEEEEEDST